MKNNIKQKAGRPAAQINWPQTSFTHAELCAANTHVSGLCLRKHIKEDVTKDPNTGRYKSLVVKTDEKRDNGSGKGRKLEVYQLRFPTATMTIPVVKVNPAPVEVPINVTTPEPVAA